MSRSHLVLTSSLAVLFGLGDQRAAAQAGDTSAAPPSSTQHQTTSELSPVSVGYGPSARLTLKTLLYIKDRYFDQTRVRPMAMFVASLKAIEATSATVHVGGSTSETLVSVGPGSKAFDTSDVTSNVKSLWRLGVRLQEIFAYLSSRLGTAEMDRLDLAVANGILATLDSHCGLASRKQFERRSAESSNDAGKVTSPAPGTSVVSSPLSPNIGYVQLTSFRKTTMSELRAALRNLSEMMHSDGGLKGIVLDLRSNPGGPLETAVQVADQFLSEGVIVTFASKQGNVREEKRANRDDSDSAAPLAVLVDRGTSAGAELVAGALKERDRAVIIGRRTSGSGTIQVVYEYGDADFLLMLTIAEMFTPSGAPIEDLGIEPDVLLIRMIPAGVSPPLEKSSVPLNPFAVVDLSRQMPTRTAPSRAIKYAWNEQADFELVFARQLLQKAPFAERNKMLQAAAALVAEDQKLEDEKLGVGVTVEIP